MIFVEGLDNKIYAKISTSTTSDFVVVCHVMQCSSTHSSHCSKILLYIIYILIVCFCPVMQHFPFSKDRN